MPNWCNNDIAINGTKEDIDALEALLQTGENSFDFNLFAPYPKEFKDADNEAKRVYDELVKEAGDPYRIDWGKVPADGFNKGGYEWCIENWGTKWSADEPTSERVRDTDFSIWFETAWSPPIPVIQKMSETFPKLKITIYYEECGMGFKGYATFIGGEVVSADEGDCDQDYG